MALVRRLLALLPEVDSAMVVLYVTVHPLLLITIWCMIGYQFMFLYSFVFAAICTRVLLKREKQALMMREPNNPNTEKALKELAQLFLLFKA